MERTIKTGVMHRSEKLDRSTIVEDKRTIELSFSSELPVERWFGNEILDHSPGSCDLSRLNNGGALLVDHDTGDQVGVVESARIDADRKGRAVVRFGSSARAQEIFQDVKDGIRSLVSVGYRINKMVREKREGDQDTMRATKWTPGEISIVAVPADPNVGVGRSASETFETHIENMPPENPAPTPAPAPAEPPHIEGVRDEATKAERLRMKEINATAERLASQNPAIRDIAARAIEDGHSIEQFRKEALEKIVPESERKQVATTPEIGMGKKDLQRYSLTRAIAYYAEHNKLDGLEKEASDAFAKQCGRTAQGFFVPQEVLMQGNRADLQVTNSSQGGYLVGTTIQTGSIIELLRNKAKISMLGARSLSGLVGDIAIPKIAGGATAYWLSEGGTVTMTNQTFGQLVLTPKRLQAGTGYRKQLLAQSSVDVEALVRSDIATVLALEKDRAAINGLGNAGEPLGILNTSNLSTGVTFGAATTFGKMVEFETNLAVSNADDGSMGYLTSPGTRGKLKTKEVASSTGIFVWSNGQVNGYRAEATNQVPSDKVIFGNWADMILAEWAGLDIVVDPYTRKKEGVVEITIGLMCDIGIRHPASFAISSDSGAQ